MSTDQHQALLAAFRRYTVESYVSNFDSYHGQDLVVLPGGRKLQNGDEIVDTRIVTSSGDPIELDYVMHETEGSWAAVDVLVDGSISRVAVQHSIFIRLVDRGGSDALIESLNEQAVDMSGGVKLP